MRSEVSKLEERHSLVEGGKPVTIEMNFREITRADQTNSWFSRRRY